ncbi:hypothetical protein N0V95_004297 [Ascochyta clinopodiicola]|nr:hypothetical protein N0V95_004297 [Ascochyta clinopodiicola]
MAAKNGCESGGKAFMCTDQSPWAINDNLAYGFAAVKLAGGINGKKMVVQATNTGSDLGNNHFDLQMPGGGVGQFNGCTAEFGAPSTGWGKQYGGISSKSECNSFPAKLKAGCNWRFDWFKNADNPDVTFKAVTCPAALTAKTGCKRN